MGNLPIVVQLFRLRGHLRIIRHLKKLPDNVKPCHYADFKAGRNSAVDLHDLRNMIFIALYKANRGITSPSHQLEQQLGLSCDFGHIYAFKPTVCTDPKRIRSG